MTVKDAIDILKRIPDDTPVYFVDPDQVLRRCNPDENIYYRRCGGELPPWLTEADIFGIGDAPFVCL